MPIDRFNIRVYGLLLREGHVLVTDEVIGGLRITKFPGGGLEFGEGPMDGLVREVREEMGAAAVDLRHFYTTPFFQQSAFRATDQLISIYYTFQVQHPDALRVGQEAFGTPEEGREWCRWLPLTPESLPQVSLPIDQVVMRMLVEGQR